MRIAVLGGNGQTGKLVAQLALDRGHEVAATVRSEGKRPDIHQAALTVMVGDPTDPKFLVDVFRGRDAVVSTLGGSRPTKASTSVYPRSASAIVQASRETGLKRVLVSSTALLFPSRTLLERILPLIVRHTVRSAREMEQSLKDAGLDWTVARCGFLTNVEDTNYRAEVDRLPPDGSSVSRAGLASFLLDAIERSDAICQVFGVGKASKH